MTHHWSRSCWRFGLAGTLTIGGVLATGDRVQAQIVLDPSLGPENSSIVENLLIQGIPSDRIDGGATRGINLFHSFLQLNVAAGRGVYFSNPIGIQNILARVVGGNPSLISGRLGVLGTANLYLLNPSGIIFGPNASLDVQGSFIASTASTVQFGAETFSTTEPGPIPLLTVEPGALFLNALSQQSGIGNQANLVAGQNLSLVAGSVNSSGLLQAGGEVLVDARAGSAVVTEVAAPVARLVASQNLLAQTVNVGNAFLSAGGSLQAQTVTAQAANLSAGFDLAVQNVTANTADLTAANNLFLNGSQLAIAGNLNIGASNHVFISDSATTPLVAQIGGNLRVVGIQGLSVQTLANPASLIQTNGNLLLESGGNIAIEGRLTSGANLSLSANNNLLVTGSQFQAVGNVELTTRNTLQLQDNPLNPFTVNAGGTLTLQGNQGINILALSNPASLFQSGGNLNLQSNRAIAARGRFTSGTNLSFSAGANLRLNDSSLNALGNVTLQAQDLVEIQDSLTAPFTVSAGGDLLIQGNQGINIFALSNPASLFQSNGNLSLVSDRSINANGQFNAGGTLAITSGGNIVLPSYTGPSLNLTAQGEIAIGAIDTSSAATNGGGVNLTAGQDIRVGSISTFSTAPTGNGGLVALTSFGGDITVTDFINASSIGGFGGGVELDAPAGGITVGTIDVSSLTGSSGSIFARALGDIITTGSVSATSLNGAAGSIDLTSLGGGINTTAGILEAFSIDGNGGIISFNAQNNIITGAIDSSSSTGNGGGISLTSRNGEITTLDRLDTYSTTGNGGNISLDALSRIVTRTLDAASDNANGGNIRLSSRSGAIDTSAGDVFSYSILGNGGNVNFSARGNITTATIDSSTGIDGSATPNTTGGTITLNSSNGAIDTTAGALLSYSYLGDGGAVSLSARENISTALIDSSSGVDGFATAGAVGGVVNLTSSNGAIDTSAGDILSYSILGNGGNVTVTANRDILTGNIDAASNRADGGNIRLTSRNGSIDTTAGELLSFVATVDGGSGGEVSLRAANNVRVGDIRTDGGVNGSGGNIRIVSDRNGIIDISDRILNSSTFGIGRGGDILIETSASGIVSITRTQIDSTVEPGSSGAGGNITISGGTVLLDAANLDTTTSGDGNGGSITVTALNNGVVSLTNNSLISTTVQPGARGTGGNVSISGGQVSLDNSDINSGTSGFGDSGNVAITANSGAIALLNSSTVNSDTSGSGNGGNISLIAPSITLFNGVQVTALTQGEGKGGSVFIDARDGSLLLSASSYISTAVDNPTAQGEGGNIDILAKNISLILGSRLEALTRGVGAAGNIRITASGVIDIAGADVAGLYSGLQTSSEAGSGSPGGNIIINSPGQPQGTLRIADGGYLSARTQSDFTGGNIEINVNNLALSGGGQLVTSATSLGSGAAGSITVNAAQGVTITGKNPNFVAGSPNPNEGASSGLFAQSEGTGDAGNLTVNTPQMLMQDSAQVSVASQGSGMGGQLTINANQLSVQTDAEISASTAGTGAGGQLSINSNQLQVQTNGKISASTTGSGDGGQLSINANQVKVQTNGEISASTTGSGKGGVLMVNASDSINLDQGGSLAARSEGEGEAGSLAINTPNFTVQNGAQATVSSTGTGNAGNLDVNARFVTLNNGGKLAAETVSGGGGNIQLRNLETLQIDNGGQISASTESGQGGTLSISASRSISLNNRSGLSARATGTGDGTAGNLLLSTRQLTVQNESEISTSTAGSGNAGQIIAQANSLSLRNGGRITSRSDGAGNAGSITIQLSDLLRTNRGEISAASEQGGGGNITVTARDIELKNSSLISTRVSSGSGGGGNISITARDIFIALEDSDILANAEDGNGGRITIRSPVFIADLFANVGPNPGRDFSRFRGNGQVDISASSRFGVSGVVSIPDFSFLEDSLDSLSETFVSTEQIVAGSCLARRNVEQGSFVVSGTGGLPNDPYNLLRGQYRVVGIKPISGGGSGSSNQTAPTQTLLPLPTVTAWKPGDPIKEAQGLMKTIDGRIVLGTDSQLAAIARAEEIICGKIEPEVSSNRL